MPGKAKQKSPLEKAAEAAKAKLDAAKEAHGKSANAANKQALESAQAAFKVANDAAAKERFATNGAYRVGVVLEKINAFGGIARSNSFIYTETQVNVACNAMREAIDAAQAALIASLAAPNKLAAAKSTFKFPD